MRSRQEKRPSTRSNTDNIDTGHSSSSEPWISWFCSIRGNEFFTEVDERWMQDEFNLYGLSDHVPHYGFARDLILDRECEVDLNSEQVVEVEKMAEHLYGLIHARYIVSPWGLEQMCEKYKNVDFGRCPRVHCEGQAALPIGQSDLPRTSYARLFCPRCNDIFYPVAKYSHIDGAYFGTTFPHLLFQYYPELIPPPPKHFVPRLFGFKIHKSSREVLVKQQQVKLLEQESRSQQGRNEDSNYYTGGSTSSVSQIYSTSKHKHPIKDIPAKLDASGSQPPSPRSNQTTDVDNPEKPVESNTNSNNTSTQ